jgi:nucleoside 2-deoxyribosyltransferase
MKVTYCAGPIGQTSIKDANVWREYVKEYFLNNNQCVDVRNPLRGKKEEERVNYVDTEIVQRDKKDINESDFIIVYWPTKCTSNGTAMEIIYAFERGIPVIFIGEWAKNDIWIRYHSTKIFNTLDNALDYIIQMWL